MCIYIYIYIYIFEAVQMQYERGLVSRVLMRDSIRGLKNRGPFLQVIRVKRARDANPSGFSVV